MLIPTLGVALGHGRCCVSSRRNRLLRPNAVTLQSCEAVHSHVGQVQHYVQNVRLQRQIYTQRQHALVCAAGFLKCLSVTLSIIRTNNSVDCCYCHVSQQETCERNYFENRVALKQTRAGSLLDNRSSCRVKHREEQCLCPEIAEWLSRPPLKPCVSPYRP